MSLRVVCDFTIKVTQKSELNFKNLLNSNLIMEKKDEPL